MKTYKQFINENLNRELTTEDLERMVDKDGKLDLSNRGLTSLPNLPDGLIHLYCSGNKLVELPPLPDSLEVLNCRDNNLTTLPPLPNGLKVLSCVNNKLTELPHLPSKIEQLYCNDNKLWKLPDLPETLNILYVGWNDLTKLPTLPKVLERLSCKNNPDITKYDLPFPSTLKYLKCDNLYGFTDMRGYRIWLEKQQWRKDNPDLATLDDIGLL